MTAQQLQKRTQNGCRYRLLVCFYRFTQGYLRDDSTALVGEDNSFGRPCVKGKAAVLMRV